MFLNVLQAFKPNKLHIAHDNLSHRDQFRFPFESNYFVGKLTEHRSDSTIAASNFTSRRYSPHRPVTPSQNIPDPTQLIVGSQVGIRE